ncbi:MAG TPA: HD domain-containing phosphohydrolase [Acidobacteriota bacterium]|nr:HD domain-containing phosphohydrolase [Acidobacteriota bacterium]
MYQRYWNLKRKPFSTGFVQDMVLFTKNFSEIYRTISVSSRLESSSHWITGPEGCGKSTLLYGLKSTLAGEAGLRLIPGRFLVDERRFFTALACEKSADNLADSLARCLERLTLSDEWAGKPMVIAIDDADLIDDDDAVRQILRLHEICAEKTLPLTVVFTGKSIPAHLEPRRSAPVSRHVLNPPADEEAVEIIRHRLRLSGAGKRIITGNAIRAAVAEADGNLARLMMICDLALQFGYETGKRFVDEQLLRDKVLPFFRRFSLDEQRFLRASAIAEGRGLAGMSDNPLGLRIIDGAKKSPPPRQAWQPPEDKQAKAEAEPEAEFEEGEAGVETKGDDISSRPEVADVATAEEVPEAAEQSGEEKENGASSIGVEMQDEVEPEEEPAPRAFFHTGLETYRKDYLAQSTARAEEAKQGIDKAKGEQVAEPVTNDMLYNFAVWLIKDVLERLRRLESVDIGPIQELSETINRRLAEDVSVLKLVLGEAGAYDLETHLVNVATLAIATGRRLNLPEADLNMLGTTALLHDVGHLHCGEELLHSEDRFDRLDFKMIKQHPQIGHDLILRQTNSPQLIADIILQEHERDDGLGYPNYLGASEIHQFARIIGLCDFFEALTHSRAHRSPLKPAEALSEIRESRTRLSERRLVAALSNAVLDALSRARL